MKKYIFIAVLVLAALTRIIPHPWNFTGVGALAIFAGSHFKSRWQAVALTWVSMFIGDLYFGLHSTMFFTYGALALTAILGHSFSEINISENNNSASQTSNRLAQNKFFTLASKVFSWGTLSLVGSLFFYLITNFGVW
ncbi:MAG TPA: hypothetical protein PLJ21_13075, partial [Pseudobdellovibrionaceae bacterium]|nr:hypothetical protein [Pseudobdellovibrionaceae bacterium]